ncbi:uncharacterized protein JCM6883_005303 [Sporobolomyces salmoneus]|uniref:uncharacterized protein n=1 Tax=Sporobolomyces salmoneus TaxID=183962 RepID=UPI00317CCA76
MSKFELELPQPPALLQRYSSIPYQFPPPLPLPTMPATSLYQREYLPPLQIPGSTLRSNASSARCSRDGSPITPVDPTPPLFARRSRSGAPMQISLPINNHSNHSPAHSVSTTSSCAPSLDSAPLQTPASWGNSAAPSSSAHHQPIHYGAPTQLPLTQSALDLAPYSALSPSSLSKFATASVPSFDFYVPPPQLENVDIYAPTTIAATLGLDPYNPSFDPTTASFDYPVQISNYSQHYPNQHPLAPTTPYLNVDNFSLDDFSASCGANFHLPSPGLTFTSSTPSWMTKTPYFCT